MSATSSRLGRILQRLRNLRRSLRFRLFAVFIVVTLVTTLVAAGLASYSVTERFERFVIEKAEDLDAFVQTSTSNLRSGLVVEVYYRDDTATQEQFLNSVNQALIVAVLLAGTVSLVLLASMANPGLSMIEGLTNAARRLASGDLSQRVEIRAHDEIGVLGVSFNHMADNLQRNEQLRRNMVSDVAHELRSPLTNLQGYLEGLRDGVLQPSSELFSDLYEEARHLSRLVCDMQDLTLAEAGQLTLSRQAINLQECVQRTIQLIETAWEDGPRARIVVDLQAGLPLVYADGDRLIQILRNLIENALAHTPVEGSVTISGQPEDGRVRVDVRDTGIGIPPDHLALVFERFYRVDPSRTRATGGSGIGLAITRQLVEAHGGTISVTSVVGQGTCFSFTIPRVMSTS